VSDLVGGAPLQPDAVVLDLGRASRRSIVVAVVLLALLTAGGVYAAADTDDHATRVVGIVIATFFGGALWSALRVFRVMAQARTVAFDRSGVHYGQGGGWTTLPWDRLAAVGVGYELPPSQPNVATSVDAAISGFVLDKVTEATKIDRRSVALELYPRDPADVDRHRALARYRKEGAGPRPDLPPVRWRLLLPPVGSGVGTIERGVTTFAPHVWLGWFQRPWSGSLIRR
jgi:hypothetical protein